VRLRRAVTIGVATFLLTASAAKAAAPELSTTDRLKDRREVASGTRAYSVGFEDGRFYANGWHITGEMGGLWTPPLKLLDGVWFGIDDQWVGPATRFTSGQGYTRFDLPSTAGLDLQRTDFVPDGRRGALYGLKMTNNGATDKTVTVKVDAHSELMGAYPWGWTQPANAANNLPDTASYDASRGALQFTDDGTPTGGSPHDYSALVATSMTPDSHATGNDYRGPQDTDGEIVCPAQTPAGQTDPMPSHCKDGPYGNGKGGELQYSVTVPANGSKTVWVGAAGSDQGLSESQSELSKLLADPEGELAAKIASRQALADRSQVFLPGDKLLQDAVDWGKQNLADLTQSADNLQIRWTSQGTQYPAPSGTVKHIQFFGAGFPDYPWLFATDGEYTNFAAVALGQFQTAEDHLRALKDVSEVLNGNSGVVVHETVTDGSVYYGHNSQTNGTNDFNTDETVKFPSAVALVWRWTGDNAFRDEMYSFAKRNLQYVSQHLDADGDGWPEGSGNVERPGMGPEKLDNAVYYIRSLFDLADMARSKHDGATYAWASNLGRKLLGRFENTWWYPAAQQYADSLIDPGNVQSFQKHWIGQTPMEAELIDKHGSTQPGIAAYDHGSTALVGRENSTYSGDRPGSRGLFHTGRGGGADGNGDLEIFSLGTAIQAVGEGNYGLLGTGTNPDDATGQRRYTDANAETMFSEPATGGTPDEQPGAMPEIFPSPGFPPTAGQPEGGNISRCWTCRSMVMQAWGNYGTAWPVMHQQLGLRPDLGNGAVSVVPQVPDYEPSVQGTNIRLGQNGSIDIRAARNGTAYTTEVDATNTPGRTLVIGATLPRGTRPTRVVLDGRVVHNYTATQTNRGVEVTVPASPGARHVLVVS
jgi:hypothetical protein